MIRYLTLDDLLRFMESALGEEPQVRDFGLLEAALARPAATVFGRDAYPTLPLKAAALLHSLCRNHALIDGNKRLAWAATAVFLVINGCRPRVDQDAVFDLVVAVASGELDEIGAIADRLDALLDPSPGAGP
ncbi:type II toxin-antitoxin system death-on-curing family toxin [Actinomycetospora termitidis]|uniref:Fic family protein n=1 Tax=Actinomycetospora termitidis TaxID=3053470 RepID=A0ABT7ME07_9PSEU|nr:Fic family protein [Actinomycetospora sp. Odt1-22]MDL5158900.1 Fic family protein [Actinomycetospora sp. Odt1-22]